MAGTQPPPMRGGGPGRVGHYPVGYPAGTGTRPRVNGQSAPDPFPRHPARPVGYRPGQAPPPGPKRWVDYPRHGRRGWRRWVPSWRILATLAGVGLLLAVLLFSAAYATIAVPSIDQKTLAQTTVLYYSDGKTEMGRLADQNRQSVQIAQIPTHVQRAVLAAEDDSFYSNSGVNPVSILRAAWSNARGNATQGGSTITQQYVKNAYAMQKDRSVTAKFQEFFIALKITQSTDKDRILEQYLNTIYFGRGAYGIQAASQAYFGTRVEKLTISQAAYLAGVINAPSDADDPKGDPDEGRRALFRWNVVLDAMARQEWISAQERAEIAAQGFPMPRTNTQRTSLKGQVGFMVKMAQAEAAKNLGITTEAVETGGYKIVTTFNQRAVKQAVEAVNDQLISKKPRPRIFAGMTAVNPKNGAIVAIYAGKDYSANTYNHAATARLQAGSTFKAFGLLAALDEDVSLYSRFSGQSPMRINGRRFQNFGNTSYGTSDLLYATQKSMNTPFLALNEEIGPEATQQVAERAGIPVKAANVDANLANVLGSANPTTVEMASAYGVFANGGVRFAPHTVRSIATIGTGELQWSAKAQDDGERVFDEDVIARLNYALQRPLTSGGTGAYAAGVDRPAAGKTGTSSDSKSAWFVGYTPQLSVAVVMYENGRPDSKGRVAPIEMKGFGGYSAITGGSFPVRIWTQFTRAALEGQDEQDFDQPVDLGSGDFLGTPAPPEPTYTPPDPTSPPGPTFGPSPTVGPVPTEQPPGTPLPTPGDGPGIDPGGDPGDGAGNGGGAQPRATRTGQP